VVGDLKSLLEPVLLGNYPSGARHKPRVDCFLKCWEAARGTTAVPEVFPPHEAGEQFIHSLHSLTRSILLLQSFIFEQFY
jgi:hypothetical protein